MRASSTAVSRGAPWEDRSVVKTELTLGQQTQNPAFLFYPLRYSARQSKNKNTLGDDT
jgi:hypothetical protein